MKKFYNSCFVSLVFALVAIAFTSIPAAAFDGITNQDQLSLKLRTIYFDRDYEKDSLDDTTLAQGVELNYESGFIANIISFGASAYMVQDINSSGSAGNNIMPKGDDDGGIDRHLSKIGQLFVNFNLADQGNVKVGAQRIKYMLVSSSGTRAIPNTYRGITANYTLDKFKFYGYAFDEWSRRHDDKWEIFTTELGEEIDTVWGVGTSYKHGGFKGDIEYLTAQDYLAKLGLRGSYTWNLDGSKLKLSGGYFASQDDGSLFKSGAEKDIDGNDDNDGSAYYVDVEWKVNMFTLGAAYTQVFDAWIEDNFSGDHGTNPFPTRHLIGPDFTNENEKVWLARVGFDLNQFVPGLSTNISYISGTGAENSLTGKTGGEADEHFFVIDTKWKIPYVKGLSFRWYYTEYNSDEVGTVAGVKGDEKDHRLYLDYVVKF